MPHSSASSSASLVLFDPRGGAFAEWDFLRGIREGWMPRLPAPSVDSQDLYGTCYEIYNRTSDDYGSIVEEYPDPRTLDWTQYQGWDATDDFVLSDPNIPTFDYYTDSQEHDSSALMYHFFLPALIVMAGVLFVARRRARWPWTWCGKPRASVGYEQLP